MKKYEFDWKISRAAMQQDKDTVIAQLDNDNIDIYEFGDKASIDRVSAKAALIVSSPGLLSVCKKLLARIEQLEDFCDKAWQDLPCNHCVADGVANAYIQEDKEEAKEIIKQAERRK